MVHWPIFLQIVGFGGAFFLTWGVAVVGLSRAWVGKSQYPTIVLIIIVFLLLTIGALGAAIK